MHCSVPTLFRAGVLLALVLPPVSLIAQEPQTAPSPAPVSDQPPAVPELADLIPQATALSSRLTSLEKALADKENLTWVEQQLEKINTLVDTYAKQFLELQAATGPRAGRLPQLREEIQGAGDALTKVNNSLAAKLRTFGNLRKEW